MKKVTIHLPDNYDSVLSITPMGHGGGYELNVTAYVLNLLKYNELKLEIDEYGNLKWIPISDHTERRCKMGRLTVRKIDIYGNKYIATGGGAYFEEESVYKALDKLAHYEDMEEQGRLIEMPCAVGDTVYAIGGVRWIGYDWKWKAYDEAYVQEIKFNLDMLGDTFFLTKEEAERELKRLKLITDPNVGSAG